MSSPIRLSAQRTLGIHLLGVASGLGGSDPGCALGPAFMRSAGLAEALYELGLDAAWEAILTPQRGASGTSPLDSQAVVCRRLAGRVASILRRGGRFSVLGGDHSCAFGTWLGVHQAIGNRGPMGLLWIDAHMDAHVPETTPSGNLHGMPVAGLLGYGNERLAQGEGSSPPLSPEHVCLIGVRSFERAEAALLQQLGVRVWFMDDIRRRGMARVLREAIQVVRRGTAGYGLSIDLDAVDPVDAPAVSTPVPHGIRGLELVRGLAVCLPRADLLGVEIAEFSPQRDRNARTARLIQELLVSIWLGRSAYASCHRVRKALLRGQLQPAPGGVGQGPWSIRLGHGRQALLGHDECVFRGEFRTQSPAACGGAHQASE